MNEEPSGVPGQVEAPPSVGAGAEPRQENPPEHPAANWVSRWIATAATLFVVCAAVAALSSVSKLARDATLPRDAQVALLAVLAILAVVAGFGVWQQFAIRRVQTDLAAQEHLTAALRSRAEMFEQLAVLDPLTELFNRRYGSEQLVREVARATRQSYPLTVLLMDLNEFKSLNDRYGHAAGDQALCSFSRALRRAIRSSDIPVRTGGDEFMVILPECRKHSVPRALARLRNLSVAYKGLELPLSFSAGWAELREDDSSEDLLERADSALYQDKRSGASHRDALRVATDTERGGKLQIVGQLTGQVAHDFNNLLCIIKGYSEMALAKLDPDDSARLKVAQIAKAAEQATQLIAQLRVFTSKGSHEWKVIDLNERVHDVMALLQPLLRAKKITLSVITGSSTPVRTQAGQIEQILLNLVTNAKDAIPGEGAISVRTRDAVLNEDFVRTHPGAHAGRHVALAVHDTGMGMDDQVRAKVFNAYFTTKPGGTGLGLATVYALVKQMGGYTDVESAPGQGTTFTVYIPLAEDSAVTPTFNFPDDDSGSPRKMAAGAS